MAREWVAGKKIESFRVYGVNSLKTLAPALDDLVGDQVVDLVAQDDARRVDVVCRDHVIAVELERTGKMAALREAAAWSPAAGTPMPTGRMTFEDGTGFDFREPAKTKRITFAVRRR
ncbi:hypothetical protein ACQEVC_12590 [Plantactinospora sp. CA-294935]|uniref:hypothetical protein n=1 Tax=Plantactinospora sp. CA-294935 TaxID=3240012 RepID=UPI003D9126F0